MKRFVDTAYVVKSYVNEPDSLAVRNTLREPAEYLTSSLTRAELACALHRHAREDRLSKKQADELAALFEEDIASGIWTIVPLTDALLQQLRECVARLPAKTFIRAGDAIQLTSALHAGADEIWSSDRHLLLAAPHFGLDARTL